MKRFPRFQQAEPVPDSSSVDLQETSTFIDKNHKEHANPLTHSIRSSWVIFWFDAHRMADELLSILLPSQFGISVQNCRFTLHLWSFPGAPISSSSTLGKHGLRFAQLQETLQQGWSKPGGHSTICQRFFSCTQGNIGISPWKREHFSKKGAGSWSARNRKQAGWRCNHVKQHGYDCIQPYRYLQYVGKYIYIYIIV